MRKSSVGVDPHVDVRVERVMRDRVVGARDARGEQAEVARRRRCPPPSAARAAARSRGSHGRSRTPSSARARCRSSSCRAGSRPRSPARSGRASRRRAATPSRPRRARPGRAPCNAAHGTIITGVPATASLKSAAERRVRQPDAAVRDGMADRPRLIRAVDRDRAALRPAGEDVRERGDPDRAPARTGRSCRSGRAAGSRSSARSASAWRASRPRPSPSTPRLPGSIKRQPPRRDVDDDARARRSASARARARDVTRRAVRLHRQLHAVPARLAVGASRPRRATPKTVG